MHNKTVNMIYQAMSKYYRKGKKSGYKQKQMRRLIAILNDISQHEGTENLSTIGRRQIIGYWRRTEEETHSTRCEKYNILVKYFEEENPTVTVPKPKTRICAIWN